MDDVRAAMLGDHEAAKRLTDAGVLLMQGDCLELLKDIPDGSVDMVLTDPPYSSGGLFAGDRKASTRTNTAIKITTEPQGFKTLAGTI